MMLNINHKTVIKDNRVYVIFLTIYLNVLELLPITSLYDEKLYPKMKKKIEGASMKKLSAAKSMDAVAKTLLWIGAAMLVQPCFALTYTIPAQGNVVGHIQYTTASRHDSLSTVGRRHNIGGYEMKEANPGVGYKNPRAGKKLLVPSRFVLPDAPRKGIVINLAELRLYYYHPDGRRVSTFPVGVGQDGWNTPLGKTSIVRKRANPTWVVPKSILENHRRLGKPIPKSMPPGPKNPLGTHALSLGFKNIVIHGTPYPRGVGLRSSHGCIRMLPEDIRKVFDMVPMGTPVNIVHQPNKVGYLGKQVFVESHVPISSSMYGGNHSIEYSVKKIVNKTGVKMNINWHQARKARSQASGYPKAIGRVL
tara:strand:+ start:73341 stop:74432 length:1092 start_codon:yes stop_codon:yes gene_type:complete